MTQLAETIRAFCITRIQKWTNGLGQAVEPTIECNTWGCGDGHLAKSKEPFKHAGHCPLTLLEKKGDTEALHRDLARTAHSLDYEGGGYSSCPICKGRTSWQGVHPRHRKNCPGALAHRTAKAEWFQPS